MGQLFPPHRFLSMLEEEIYGANSPIWESGFTMPPSEGTQLVPRPGMLHSSTAGSAWSPWLAYCPWDNRVVGCGSNRKIPWGSDRAERTRSF